MGGGEVEGSARVCFRENGENGECNSFIFGSDNNFAFFLIFLFFCVTRKSSEGSPKRLHMQGRTRTNVDPREYYGLNY